MRWCALSFAVAIAACGGGQKPAAPAPPAAPAKPPAAKPAEPPPNATVSGVYINDGCTQMKGDTNTIALLQKACGGKDGEGCSKLAGFYLCGVAVPRDLAKAASFAEQGCDYNYFQSCGNVAMMIAYPDPPISPPTAGSTSHFSGSPPRLPSGWCASGWPRPRPWPWWSSASSARRSG